MQYKCTLLSWILPSSGRQRRGLIPVALAVGVGGLVDLNVVVDLDHLHVLLLCTPLNDIVLESTIR